MTNSRISLNFSLIAGLILASLLAGVGRAQAQVPESLSAQQAGTSHRLSSTDPNGKNADYRQIPPGATLELGEIHGAGEFTHLWFTIASPSPKHLEELVLRIYWDGAKTPAVECPMGDFFAQGNGAYVEFRSAAVSVGGRMALNCYWPMPFKTGARVTVTNEGAKRVDALYYNLDYKLLPKWSASARYFHTDFRVNIPAKPLEPLTICDVKGSGQYVGTIVTVQTNSPGWWGEGNDLWFVDGSVKPTIEGTGSEDYFCGAWDFGHAFQTPYFGVTYYDDDRLGGEVRGITNTVYRWHIPDPVVFRKSLVFKLQQGSQGGNETRNPLTNNYATVGLFYVDHPEGSSTRIPDLADRTLHVLPLPTNSGS